MARRQHTCDVPGCGATRLRWQRLCDSCWRRLPGDIRTEVTEAFRQGRWSDHRASKRRAAEFIAGLDRPKAPPPENAPWMMRD
jgi:hypothetical protein